MKILIAEIGTHERIKPIFQINLITFKVELYLNSLELVSGQTLGCTFLPDSNKEKWPLCHTFFPGCHLHFAIVCY